MASGKILRPAFESGTIELEEGSPSSLLCPSCGSNYLHQSGVTVYDRSEDAKVVTQTDVLRGRISSHRVPSEGCANPSLRRHGLVIQFACENCAAKPIELTIAQHKGLTLVGWRVGPTYEDDTPAPIGGVPPGWDNPPWGDAP